MSFALVHLSFSLRAEFGIRVGVDAVSFLTVLLFMESVMLILAGR